MSFNNQTEIENLRLERDEAMAELRRRDTAEVRARIAALEEAKRADEQRARSEAERAAAEELERRRRAAWTNFRTDEALARGNDAFVSFLTGPLDRHVPAEGWPPGTAPEMFPVVGVPEDETDISNTLLGQWLAKAGVKMP